METDILRSINYILLALTRERDRLQQEVDDDLYQHPGLKQDRALLQTIPSVGPAVSLGLLAMRKLLHIAHGVLKTQTEYRPQTA